MQKNTERRAPQRRDPSSILSKTPIPLPQESLYLSRWQLSIEPFYEKVKERIPIGRADNREAIFGIAAFLASDASDFVNGAVILVDSGAIASDGFPVVPTAEE